MHPNRTSWGGKLDSWNEDVEPPYNTRQGCMDSRLAESAPQTKAEDRDPPGGLQQLRFSFGDAKVTSQSDAERANRLLPPALRTLRTLLLVLPGTNGTSGLTISYKLRRILQSHEEIFEADLPKWAFASAGKQLAIRMARFLRAS